MEDRDGHGRSEELARAVQAANESAKPFRQLFADMILWLTLLLLFLSFRVALFLIFRSEISEQPSSQAFVRCFETGLKSDATAATWAILPSLALTVAGFFYPLGVWHQRSRRLSILITLTLCAVIFVADIGYFAEYDNQFDHWIFGLIYDDRAAIFATIWKSYHILFLIFLGAIAVAISVWVFSKILRQAESAQTPSFLGTKTARVITVVFVIVWAFVGARVWLGKNFAGLKNAASTGDVFLNKIVLNPFFALRYAIWQEHTMQKSAGLKNILPRGDVRGAAAALYPGTQNAANLDDCLSRTAPGTSDLRPSHIFIVVMESYDAWAMQPEYAGLHLTDRLSQLGREDFVANKALMRFTTATRWFRTALTKNGASTTKIFFVLSSSRLAPSRRSI